MHIFQFLGQEYTNTGISFNTDFLEANVLNILLLLSGLIYVLKQFLGSILSIRQEKVLFAIRESEERLEQANIRLNEAEKQLAQTQIIINQIIEEAELTAQRVRQSILEQGKYDIEKLTLSSKVSIKSAENQVRQQIRQQITALAISKVSIQLQNQMTPAIQMKIIDNSIIQLKGDI
uniref:ATP synthase subunit b, chloroplastic n=1 Tax=Acrosorium ciliolatum TaxID=1550622 RepID=A0A1Z1M2B6_9FLOR|nr:ATP synthase CF0 subunit I [Acrosorium ciliolatum]ARW59991.1 ATP synthase CF0 subunit I [Acrosorium ciliolatum]